MISRNENQQKTKLVADKKLRKSLNKEVNTFVLKTFNFL